jgi:hypothetical protein
LLLVFTREEEDGACAAATRFLSLDCFVPKPKCVPAALTVAEEDEIASLSAVLLLLTPVLEVGAGAGAGAATDEEPLGRTAGEMRALGE